jgi:hypothetical protein
MSNAGQTGTQTGSFGQTKAGTATEAVARGGRTVDDKLGR